MINGDQFRKRLTLYPQIRGTRNTLLRLSGARGWKRMCLAKSSDSFMNQLLSITLEMYPAMDEGYEIRGLPLDISKEFYKM